MKYDGLLTGFAKVLAVLAVLVVVEISQVSAQTTPQSTAQLITNIQALKTKEQLVLDQIRTRKDLEDRLKAAQDNATRAADELKTAYEAWIQNQTSLQHYNDLSTKTDEYKKRRDAADKLIKELGPLSSASRTPMSQNLVSSQRSVGHTDNFFFLPRVTPVPRYSDVINGTVLAEHRDPRRARSDIKPPQLLCDHRFPLPASFSLPRYGLAGDTSGEEALLIYEGMQFRYDADGHYHVHFTARTPAMPVKLRMELVLFDAKVCQLYTLNLPVIQLSRASIQQSSEEAEQVVHCEGFLPVLRNNRHLSVVKRNGSAQFGFGAIL